MSRTAPRSATHPRSVPTRRRGSAPMPPMPRLVILAEQELVGEAIRVGLRSQGLELIRIRWSGDALGHTRRRITAHRPQAGLLVGEFSEGRLRERATQLVSSVRVPWLLLANDPSDVGWGGLLGAGLSNIGPTSIGLDSLASSLRLLMSGGGVMASGERDHRVQDWQRLEALRLLTAERVADLTPKEYAVLGELYEGRTVIEIAARAGVTEGTVRSQVKSVLRKLGVNSQIAAVAALRQLR